MLKVVLSALAAPLEKAWIGIEARADGAMPISLRCAAIAPAMPVPCGCGFSGAPPTASNCVGDHAVEIGVLHVDLRIDHRDRDIGALDLAVDVEQSELARWMYCAASPC